ncbi:MAG: NAD(P)H-dependent glycerol-3-phosphate dehydrogenase [Pseudomonadota bacterium]
MSRIGVVGAGSWGTAIAHTMAASGHKTTLWSRSQKTAAEIYQDRTNKHYLGDIRLNATLSATCDLSQALDGASFIFLVTPSQTTEAMACEIRKAGIERRLPIICCAKGLDQETGRRVSQIVEAALPDNPVMVLSGPSFARDVASGLPTAVTLAGNDLNTTLSACKTLSSAVLRLYASDDMCGVELGGALKNVMAIAAGIVHGVGLGQSAKAALIARGFAEMERIAQAYGARSETLKGLSGLGDLVLTCGSQESRNYSYGLALTGKVTIQKKKLAEGAFTAASAQQLAENMGVAAPITKAVADVLSGHQTIPQAVESLTSRPVKAELD